MLPGQKRLLLAASHSPPAHIDTLQISTQTLHTLCESFLRLLSPALCVEGVRNLYGTTTAACYGQQSLSNNLHLISRSH